MSRVIQRCLRAGAEVGRFGGEEFVLAIGASQERTRVLANGARVVTLLDDPAAVDRTSYEQLHRRWLSIA